MDDPELKKLLKENIRLEEDSNRMIRSIYRSQKWSAIFSLIRWVIIIGAAIGLFYYLKPVLDSLSDSYQFITGHPLPDFPSFFKK